MSIHKYVTAKGATRYRVMWREPDGSQRSKTVTSMREARDVEASVRVGTAPTPTRGQVTLGEWLVTWFERYSKQWSITTTRQRKHICDRYLLKTPLARVPVAAFTKAVVMDHRASLEAAGATPNVANQVMRVLSAALTAAVEHELLDRNPCLGVKRLRTPPTKRRALTPVEVEKIRRQMPTARDEVIVSLLAYAGLRPAEVCALQWRHVRDQTILVEQSAQSGMIVATKTGRVRSVSVNPVLAEDLAAYGRSIDDVYVVSGERGGILSWKNWFRRVWVPAVRRAGIEATPYDLRHTFVTLMIYAGATIPEVSAAVGHANPTMTLNIYSHVYAEAQGVTRTSPDQAIRAARSELAASRPHAAAAHAVPAPA